MPVSKDARETARQIMQWGYYEYRSDNFEEHLNKAEQLIHARESKSRKDELCNALENCNQGSHGVSKYYVRRRIKELSK